MTAVAAPPARRAPAGGPLLPRLPARLIGFVLLGGAGALAWGGMVEPRRGWALLLYTLLAAACGIGLAHRRRASAPARAALTGAVLLVLAGGGLLVAGVPLRLFAPGSWDIVAEGLAQGAEAAPAVNVPYGGDDPWVRVVVLISAPALLALGACAAFWPRRDGRLGFPLTAAAALAAVSGVPDVQVPGDAPVLTGALLAVLLVTFLGLERVPRRAAPLAAGLVAAATVVGVVLAPALDAEEPLIDYEEIAQSLTPEAGERFSWNHEYGPMDWPRDGVVVLRVKARRGTYWKATALTSFNGVRWERDAVPERRGLQTEINRSRPEWVTRMSFTLGNMTTEEFIGAGTVLSVGKSPRQPVVSGPGEFRVEDRPLQQGHSYEAEAYVPRPSTRALAAAGTLYPASIADQLAVELPPERRGADQPEVRFGALGSTEQTLARAGGRVLAGENAEDLVERSAYRRVYALAQELREGATTPYAYVRAVERHLADGFTYSESPPERRVPLDAFLFTDRLGYCQQFSGAMALLLRMGGVPARVATGFSPGELDRERDEYVVRDTDAHSWVEVYFPQIGWVAFDPTPSEAPARSRELGTAPALPGEQTPADPGPAPERDLAPEPVGPLDVTEEEGGQGVPAAVLWFVALLVVGAGAVGVVTLRRNVARDRAPVQMALDDLERAMRRIGQPLPPGSTLGALGRRFAGTPGEPYLRSLERARYGPADSRGPDARERAGLRRLLAARGGPLGRLRAWWALPPG